MGNRKCIDCYLEYPNRSLRILPGKLLFGPTGARLFADYLDKIPGFSGRIEFIHKLNLPGIFTVRCNDYPEAFESAETTWYPSHLSMRYENEDLLFREDKFITWDDCAVSCQQWTNRSGKSLTLVFDVSDAWEITEQDGCIGIERDCISHDIHIVGAISSTCGIHRARRCVVEPGRTVHFSIVAAVSEAGKDTVPGMTAKAQAYLATHGEDYLDTQIEEYDGWFDDVPVFDCDDPLLNTTWWYRWFILRHNYAEPGCGNFHHGTFYEGRSHKVVKDLYSPWGHEFTQLIPLSTPLHITDARWKHNGCYCREALRTLLDSMDRDGVFRMMMVDRFGYFFGNYSEWAFYLFTQLHDDSDFIKEVLPSFKTNVIGVWNSFKNDDDDLQIAYNHRRTGKEYQPSYWYFNDFPDDAYEEDSYTWLKRIDLSIYLYLNALGTAELCHAIGDTDEDFFRDLAARLKDQVLEKMWDEETGFFYDLHYATEEKALVKGVTGIYPFWAGIAGERYLRALEKYFDPEQFATGSAFASVSKDCPVFMPQGSWKGIFFKGRDGCMWAGPSWPYTTSIVLDAIAEQSKRSGHRYDDQFAVFLREYSWQHYRDKDLHQPYLVEHYNAETGEMLSDEVDYNHSFYIDLIIRHVAGINPEKDGFRIEPLDIGLKHFSLENVRVGEHEIGVRYSRDTGYEVRVDGDVVFHSPVLDRYTHRFKREKKRDE